VRQPLAFVIVFGRVDDFTVLLSGKNSRTLSSNEPKILFDFFLSQKNKNKSFVICPDPCKFSVTNREFKKFHAVSRFLKKLEITFQQKITSLVSKSAMGESIQKY